MVRLSLGFLSEFPTFRIMDGPSVIAAASRTVGPARPRCRGFLPLSRWGDDSASLRAFVLLALLGFFLPGAFPFPASACSVVALTVRPSASASRQPRDRSLDGVFAHAPAAPPFGLLPGTSGKSLSGHRYPVLQSFKEPGNRLASFEVAGPSEVFILVPSTTPVCPVCRRVSDRPSDPHFQVHFSCYGRPKTRSIDPQRTFAFVLRFPAVA